MKHVSVQNINHWKALDLAVKNNEDLWWDVNFKPIQIYASGKYFYANQMVFKETGWEVLSVEIEKSELDKYNYYLFIGCVKEDSKTLLDVSMVILATSSEWAMQMGVEKHRIFSSADVIVWENVNTEILQSVDEYIGKRINDKGKGKDNPYGKIRLRSQGADVDIWIKTNTKTLQSLDEHIEKQMKARSHNGGK